MQAQRGEAKCATGSLRSLVFLLMLFTVQLSQSGCNKSSSSPATGSGTSITLNTPSAININSNSASIIWMTNVPATSQVNYGPTSSYGSQTAVNSALLTSHSQSLTGLQAGQLYHYSVVSADANNNKAVSGDFTFTTAPLTSAQTPTLIYSTACPLAVPSGAAWQSPVNYRCPLPELTTAGSTLILFFGYDSTGSNQVFAVSDDKSDTFSLDITSSASNSKTVRMYRATNVAAGASYVNVQLTSGSQNGYWQPLVAEFYNADLLDASSCHAATSTSITAGSLGTLAASGDLIFQATYASTSLSNTSFSPGSQANIAWNLLLQLLGDGAAAQYGVYNSTTALDPTFTAGTSNPYISCAVALKANVVGSAPAATVRVVHQEHDAMPKNAANPWNVGMVATTSGAVYLSYMGNDAISSVTSSPAPTVGWTASGPDHVGANGHNHTNIWCAKFSSPPGALTISITRAATTNDSINMMYDVVGGTCNVDVDSSGQDAHQLTIVPSLTTCSGCLTPTKQNDIIFANEGQGFCTATGVSAPSGAIFDSAWFSGNTIDGPTQTDENNFWMHYYNGSSLSAITVTITETCGSTEEGYWAGRVAAYQSSP